MNERDTDAMSAVLVKHGFRRVADESSADIVIVNTCSVRGKAEDKAIGKLRLLVCDKKERACLIVGAIGCMVQRLKGEILEQVPGLDFAVGTHRLACVPSAIGRVIEGKGPVLDVAGMGHEDEAICDHMPGGFSAFVNILYGCNRRCSYCVVPVVRGTEWSRPADAIVEEAAELARNGVKELTLLGQSVMSYGKANKVWSDGARSPGAFHEPLPRLLEAISAIPGIKRIRFTSGHPSGCTAELVRAMKELGPVCEHLHIPLQSGSDRILRAMRRGYTADDYRRAVALLRASVPGIAITTDIIVGFPGETLEDFETTLAFMREIGFDNSFIFKYSPRPSTDAEKMSDDVSAAEKMRRNKVLLAEQEVMSQAANGKIVGQTREILVEGAGRKSFGRWAGRTRDDRIVVFDPGSGTGRGDLVNLRITRAMPHTLYGELI